MATCLRPLGILLRNRLSTYNINSRSCKDKLIRTQLFRCSDHLKRKLYSLCIKSRKDLKVEDLARPACCYLLISRSMTENGVGAKNLKALTELAEFDALFPEIVDDLTKNEIKDPEIADAFIRFKEVLHYNVSSGKEMTGLLVVTSYKHLVSGASQADLKIACVLGWCVELLQACYNMVDDVMDNSQTRRGQLCWYKKDKVGLTAINDAFFLESCVYRLLRKYIRDKPYYTSIMEFSLQSSQTGCIKLCAVFSKPRFHFTFNFDVIRKMFPAKTTLQTIAGQCLDMTASESKGDFSQFTMERFNAMAKWKFAFFAFYCPIIIAMLMAEISDENTHNQVEPLLLQIGQLFQVHNDYLDCYDNPGATRQVGTDIEENKCSWLIVKALEIASNEQKEELKLNYGKCEKEAVEKVKAIYRDLKLEDVFKQYEESSYQDISHLINSLDCAVPKEVFLDCISSFYKHDK